MSTTMNNLIRFNRLDSKIKILEEENKLLKDRIEELEKLVHMQAKSISSINRFLLSEIDDGK